MERSFAEEVKQLQLGQGQILRGEGILAITKALLQSGVSYVGGYPGAPVSHLLDVMADANEPVLKPMGVYLDASANEAAAALLGASYARARDIVGETREKLLADEKGIESALLEVARS